MLTIRSEQLEAFQTELLQRFEQRLIQEIWTQFPDEAAAIGADRLPDAVSEAIAAARGLALDGDFALQQFVYLQIHYQPGFLKAKATRWMEVFLDEKASTPDSRVQSLHDAMWQRRRYHSFLNAANVTPPNGETEE